VAMTNNGLSKLTEESGELLQIVGKLLQYPKLQLTTDDRLLHPDGTNLRHRLQEEMADVIAALEFVANKLELDTEAIDKRACRKVELFRQWDMGFDRRFDIEV